MANKGISCDVLWWNTNIGDMEIGSQEKAQRT